MRGISTLVVIALGFGCVATPQGRPVDWPSLGGDARRTGWERSDIRMTKDNVKDFQLVLKRKIDGAPTGPHSLTPPVVIGLLISYKGFKELGFVANSAGELWALDVDLNKVFWRGRFEGSSSKPNTSAPCSGMAVTPALTPPVAFGGARRPVAPGAAAAPVPPPAQTASRSARIGGSGFGAARSVFMLAGDGKLRQVNSSDGTDQFPPLEFVPAGSQASSLTVQGTVIYTATTGNCGGVPDAVWAIDLGDEEPRPAKFALNGGRTNG